MRNFSIILTAVSFAFIVFGFVMSFFIQDPLFLRAVVFVCGLLTTISLYFVSTSLPSCSDKIYAQQEKDQFERDIWNRIDRLEQTNLSDLERVERRFDDANSDVYRSIDEVYRAIENAVAENCKKGK